MEFPTTQFAYFAALTLTIAWLLRQRRTIQKAALLSASYYFAWKWQPLFLAVLIGASLANYFLGRALVALEDGPGRRRVFWGAMALNLLTLGFFKYYGFFVDNLHELATWLDLEVHLPLLEIIAPFGISFYTFQGIAYLVDTYRRTAVQPKSVLDFLLFLAFFPQFGAGPICRSHDLLPQIMAPAPAKIPDLSRAMVLIATGLFKKMVLGTFLATQLTTDAFIAPANWSSAELVLAVYAYTAQVYLDFSGYTDIARGVGLLFGFELPENFNYPYRASNIGDFWRRWHMTFSSWLREYIYFPLGGSRRGRLRCYANLMVTFVACGVWHGATWGYVLWGALHGIGLSVYKASLDLRRDAGLKTEGPFPWWWTALGWLSTLSFCAFVRILFKTPDLETAETYAKQILSGALYGNGFNLLVLFVTGFCFAMNFWGKKLFERFVDWHDQLPTATRPFAWAAATLLLFSIKPYGVAATIYFAF